MSRKQPKRRAGRLASAAIAGFFILVVACGVGLSAASADSSDDLARSGAFGFDEATHVATIAVASGDTGVSQADLGTSGQQVLTTTSARDISAGLSMAATGAADQAAPAEKPESASSSESAQSKKTTQSSASKKSAASTSQSASKNIINGVEQIEGAKTIDELVEHDLAAVDWSVGKAEFVEEWTKRIDKYLKGTPLSGYGSVFAEAAWENGVDPRWSPAISNTESGNGQHCFLSHNAWGWGDDAWPDWKTAIRAHVAGLAAGYGYSVTFEAAQKYCPPNCVHWYNNTTSQMALI